MKTVTITISGPISSGKTTLAKSIEKHLGWLGFDDVTNNDGEEISDDRLLKILKEIRRTTDIQIQTVCIRHEAVSN